MLTISQLAAYSGVTVRAVRHYHQIGLLPEPERDRLRVPDLRRRRGRTTDPDPHPGRRRRAAGPGAGTPRCGPEEFSEASRRSTRTCAPRSGGCRTPATARPARRRRAPGAPPERRGYLDRLRGLGVDERYIELERGLDHDRRPGAAPDRRRHRQEARGAGRPRHGGALPPSQRGARLAGRRPAGRRGRRYPGTPDDSGGGGPGEVGADGFDDRFVDLLDSTMVESSPVAERFWRSWRSGAGRAGPASSARPPIRLTARCRSEDVPAGDGVDDRVRDEEQDDETRCHVESDLGLVRDGGPTTVGRHRRGVCGHRTRNRSRTSGVRVRTGFVPGRNGRCRRGSTRVSAGSRSAATGRLALRRTCGARSGCGESARAGRPLRTGDGLGGVTPLRSASSPMHDVVVSSDLCGDRTT